MKKLIAILMAVTMVLCLAACGTDEAAKNPSTPADNGNNPVQDSFVFTFNGTDIALHAPAAAIVAALGEPMNYSESTSCAFDGLDKTYEYSNFAFTTYPIGDKDYINSIWFKNDLVTNDKGITIRSPKAAVEAAYGADAYNGVNAYTITKGHGKLEITIDGETVTGILYSATFD